MSILTLFMAISSTGNSENMFSLLPTPTSGWSSIPAPELPPGKTPATIELEDGNFVALIGKVDENSVSGVLERVSASKSKHMYLFISSPGGNIVAGAQLIAALHGSGKHFTCIADFAASMAFVILQSPPCTERLVMSSSITMQHQAAYGIEGKDANNQSMMKFIQSMISSHDTFQAKRLGLTLEQFKNRTHDDWWLWGLNSITEGVADREALVKCTGNLASQHETLEFTGFMGMKFSVEVNKCPLITKIYSVKPIKPFLSLSMSSQDTNDKVLAEFLAARNPRELLKTGKFDTSFDMTP
jgi:ATP-dependent protease ClpP protease subunit